MQAPSSSPLTAERYHRPSIPLVDPDSGEKIKLRLRTMAFRQEIASLPADMLQLQELVIKYRGGQNENIYMLVSAWNKLRVYEKFWETFRFRSEEEYLAYYGLPDSATLKGWTVMVELFNKATFVLLGDEVLDYMIRSVGRYQPDTDARKKDYQAIFDRYCGLCDAFDKTAFYDQIRRYVEEQYEAPAAKQAGMKLDEFRRKSVVQRTGKTARRIIQEAPKGQKFGPTITHDFDWKEERCPYCVSKLTIIGAFQEHTLLLEGIIRKKLGSKHVPQRPAALKNL